MVTANPEIELNITNTPANNLVPSNFVYVNAQQFPKRTLVKVNNCVFIAEPHSAIQAAQIGVNRFQRISAHIPLNKSIKVQFFTPPNDDFLLSNMTLEIDYAVKESATNVPIDAKLFLEHFKSTYEGQVFADEQKFLMEFNGVFIVGTVSTMKVFHTAALKSSNHDEDLIEIPELGMLTKNTEVLLVKPKGSTMELRNMDSVGSTTIFKNTDFSFSKLGIGGLDDQFAKIFRRAFASRVFPADIVKKIGIKHVKGILLFGPPGTGKTLMARQIGKLLNTKEPKVVNGPEILNKYVGQSEENIRNLFKEAEEEYSEKGDNSELHLIIFDEIDAICKQRGTTQSGTGVNDSVVNQLLSKIDGVNALNNVLIIGMTNRLDLIDEALLRPGRFEVQIEIGLPDEKGRLQIFNIHTEAMRKNKFMGDDVQLAKYASATKNYSGAEIEGVVKSATSYALTRQIDTNNVQKLDTKNIKVTASDFDRAVEEVKPAFGVSQEEFDVYLNQKLIPYGDRFEKLLATCKSFIRQAQMSKTTNLLSVLLHGENGAGKTTLAAHLAVASGFPFVKIISPEQMVGYNEASKCSKITKVFMDAYKSPLSIIVLDNIERLIEYVHNGIRFSNVILQALLVLLKKNPPPGRKLLIFGTTSLKSALRDMEIVDAFNSEVEVPSLNSPEVANMLVETGAFEVNSKELANAVEATPKQICVKKLLNVIEMARSRIHDTGDSPSSGDVVKGVNTAITYEEYVQSLRDCGVYIGYKDIDYDITHEDDDFK